jgi:predicted ATPase with chaperone activity
MGDSKLESPAMPPAPQTVEQTGVPAELVQQLIYKTLHLSGELTGAELAERLGVLFSVIDPFLDQMKRERHAEISGAAIASQAYTYRLTQTGHSRAAGYAEHSQYVGKLPVPLKQYREYMLNLASRHFTVTRQSVRQAFSHLVLADAVLDRLGPAIAARHSLFIYGPPGNGKTLISQAIGNLLTGDIAVPHAIAIDTEVIRIYDPLNHEAVDSQRSEIDSGLALQEQHDERWVRCKRPVVTVGGELTMDSLELGYAEQAGFYRAPLQMLANGGVLVIDDFGRQRLSPRELLNRWIVPLESRIDHLTLQTGQKFEMPFDVLVVFATNLNPLDLVDESFLRRIRYKVYAESPTKQDFMRIFELCCTERGLAFDPLIAEALITTELEPRRVQLRGCQPRDLIQHAMSLAEYTDQPRALTSELLAAACATYFLADEDQLPG